MCTHCTDEVYIPEVSSAETQTVVYAVTEHECKPSPPLAF